MKVSIVSESVNCSLYQIETNWTHTTRQCKQIHIDSQEMYQRRVFETMFKELRKHVKDKSPYKGKSSYKKTNNHTKNN